MSIAIKDAVKIAYDEARSHGLKVIPDCGEGPFGWSFSFASYNDLKPVPGGLPFHVAPDGEAKYFYDGRPDSIPPSGPAPGVQEIDIKPLLAELGEPYISLKDAVKIARDKIESFPKGPPPPLSFTFIPECWDMEGTGWEFFVISDLVPQMFGRLTVSCYGEASDSLSWDDLPLPDISEYEDSGWSKVDISEYLAEIE